MSREQWTVQAYRCDAERLGGPPCNALSPRAEVSWQEARSLAVDQGWSIAPVTHLCPAHADLAPAR